MQGFGNRSSNQPPAVLCVEGRPCYDQSTLQLRGIGFFHQLKERLDVFPAEVHRFLGPISATQVCCRQVTGLPMEASIEATITPQTLFKLLSETKATGLVDSWATMRIGSPALGTKISDESWDGLKPSRCISLFSPRSTT